MISLHTPVEREIVLVAADGTETVAGQLLTTNLPEEGDHINLDGGLHQVTHTLLFPAGQVNNAKFDTVKVYLQDHETLMQRVDAIYERFKAKLAGAPDDDAPAAEPTTADEFNAPAQPEAAQPSDAENTGSPAPAEHPAEHPENTGGEDHGVGLK